MEKCIICESRNIKVEFNGLHFCSKECFEKFINENYTSFFEGYIQTHVCYLCSWCGEVVHRCDCCNRRFLRDDDIICSNEGHFCSEKCLKKYIIRKYSKEVN